MRSPDIERVKKYAELCSSRSWQTLPSCWACSITWFGGGEGLNSVRAGLRLGYEVTGRFAPYIGAYWEKEYGGTADFSRASGDNTEDTGVVAGVKLVF